MNSLSGWTSPSGVGGRKNVALSGHQQKDRQHHKGTASAMLLLEKVISL
jgi:hypothetical protein